MSSDEDDDDSGSSSSNDVSKGDLIDMLQDQELGKMRKKHKILKQRIRRLYELVKELEKSRMRMMEKLLPEIDAKIKDNGLQGNDNEAKIRAIDSKMATTAGLSTVELMVRTHEQTTTGKIASHESAMEELMHAHDGRLLQSIEAQRASEARMHREAEAERQMFARGMCEMGEKHAALQEQVAVLTKQTEVKTGSLEELLAEMSHQSKQARTESEAQIAELRAVCAAQAQTISGQQEALRQAREQTEVLLTQAIEPLLARLAAVESARAEEVLESSRKREEARAEAEVVRAREEQERCALEARMREWQQQMETQVGTRRIQIQPVAA